MTSAAFSPEAVKTCLDGDGFFDLHDAAMGEKLAEIEQRGFPFTSDYGLEFYKKHILDNIVSKTRRCHVVTSKLTLL